MAHQPGTILKLKEPKSTKDSVFPYDEVEVIGSSPVTHDRSNGEWSGSAARGVIIRPLHGFASNLDEPQGKVQALYDVVSVPEPVEITQTPKVLTPIKNAEPTPEDVFASEAPSPQHKKGDRISARKSPLGDVSTPANVGPLDGD